MSALKKLAGDTAIYGLSSIVGRFLNYLLVPFYTAVFHPEDFGVVTELYAYAAFLNVVFTYGMETTYFRFCNKPLADKELVFKELQTLITFTTFCFCTLGFLSSAWISSLLKYPGRELLLCSLFTIVGLDTILALPFAQLRQQGNAKKFASIKMMNIILNIGLNFFLLVALPSLHLIDSAQVGMVFVANLLSNAIQYAFFIPNLRKGNFLPASWNKITPYLHYGLPIMIMGLAGMINEVVDRIVLKFFLPEHFYPGKSQLAALGVYGACYKLSIFMSLGIQAFRYASEPFFFSRSTDKNSPILYAKVMHWFILCCTGVFLSVSLNLDWIQFILRNPMYREGILVVPVLLLANLFLGVYYNLSIWYKLTDKTQYGMWISIGGALLTLTLNILLVPVLGYMGSAFATLACYCSMAIASYVLGNKFYTVPYNLYFTIFIVSLASFLVFGWLYYFPILNGAHIIAKNVSWTFLVGFLFVIGRKTKYL